MKKYAYILFISLTLLFTACNDNEITSCPTVEQPIPGAPTLPGDLQGDGTNSNPYVIGSGEYLVPSWGNVYQFQVNTDVCNIVAYDIDHMRFSDTFFLDDKYSNFYWQTEEFIFATQSKGIYQLIAQGDDNATFGIFSPCIDNLSNYEPTRVEDGSHTFSDRSKLYKIELAKPSTIEINNVDGLYRVLFYDKDLNSIYSEYGGYHSIHLELGTSYMLIVKYPTNATVEFTYNEQ